MLILYVIIGILAGVAIANMTPINAQLRNKVHSPFVSVVISITISTIVMAIITLISGQSLLPKLSFITSNPAYIWFGGVIGAVYIVSNVLMFPKIGSIETVILPLLGQILMGVVIDALGLFGGVATPVKLAKIIGVVLLMVGLWITIVLSEKNRETKLGTAEGIELWGWRAWGLLIGGATAIQQTLNGQLGGLLSKVIGDTTKGTIQGSFFAFFVGLVAIVVISLIRERRILPTKAEWKTLKPYNFLGGFFNAIVGPVRMFLRIVLQQTAVVALVDFGQIATGLIVQHFGWWGSPKNKVNALQIVGVVTMFIGVLLIVGIINF